MDDIQDMIDEHRIVADVYEAMGGIGAAKEKREIADTLEAVNKVYLAADHLKSEVKGMLGIERWAIAELISETNMRCLEGRVENLDAAIEELEGRDE